MAQNITLLGASYSDVPAVELPKTGGGTALFTDVTGTTAEASDVLEGVYFYTADGTYTEGTNTGTSITVVETTDEHGGTIVDITGEIVRLQEKSATPSETAQIVTPDSGYTGLSKVNVGAISGTYVGSGVTRRSSTDLSTSGATVTVPSGYYESQASKSVASGTEGTPTATKGSVSNHAVTVTPSVTNTAGYIAGGTHTGTGVSVSASELVSGTYSVTSSGTKDVTNYASASVPAGTATAPSTISGTSATVSTGTNTLTLSKTVSVTPNVSTAGYISSGTAGNSSVSLTANVTTKASATITPGTSNQTIASGTYLTGTQTISGDANLIASNIASGVTIFGVTGTHSGGGGGIGTLIQTTSLGALSTSSTSATDTGKKVTLAQSTGWQGYDLLLVDISVDTTTNGRHTSTVTPVLLTGTSDVGTKNTYTVGSNKWNSKLSSSGTASTRQSTTAYGVFINTATVNTTTLTLTLLVYYRYNSNSTGTLNGTYTARVYGIKLIDLIGG